MTGQVYGLQLHVCWKNQGNRIWNSTMMIRWKKYSTAYLLIPRSSSLLQLSLKLPITVSESSNFAFMHGVGFVSVAIYKKLYLQISCSKQYPKVVHKKKSKKRGNHCKKKILLLKKATQHQSCFSPLSTPPSFSKAHCSAMRFPPYLCATYAASWS